MSLLLKRIKIFFYTTLFLSVFQFSVHAERLSSMVDKVLENHEDIINANKELEEDTSFPLKLALNLRL